MIFIPRINQKLIEKSLFKGKVAIIYGPRQVGKTTLAKNILEKQDKDGLYLNCEHLPVQQQLSVPDPERLKKYIGDRKLIVFDEAQKVTNIGLILKILVDSFPKLQIIATGSSSFELSEKISEPLTGRVNQYILYPFSVEEIKQKYNNFEIDSKLENLMRFGAYPEVFSLSEQEAINRLNEITSNYLFRDVLSFEKIKKSSIISDLLQMIALQLGQEVSYDELATKLGVSRLTIIKYIDLLEKSFILFSLRSFSRNPRKELSKSIKLYFYDLGIRNTLIQNHNPFKSRNDVGALWENFLIMERIKRGAYHQTYSNKYFWRTYQQSEIDFIEERGGQLFAYEFKWNKEKKVKAPKFWQDSYKDSEFKIISPGNYFDFVM